jgi:predicted nucleic acid-binding protein
LELHAEYVILDDRSARRLAHALGLRAIGTLGVLLAAKRRGVLERVQPSLHDLRERRFFMGQTLYDHILRLADEVSD